MLNSIFVVIPDLKLKLYIPDISIFYFENKVIGFLSLLFKTELLAASIKQTSRLKRIEREIGQNPS